jgi:DNA-binding transcriptional LysR family regulator
MQPTPRAKALIAPITNALAAFRRVTSDMDEFDPQTSRTTFRISLTDIGQVVLLPLIASRLRELAPKSSLEVSSTTEDSYKRLESDDLDLAFGSVRKLQPSYFQKNLFKEHFVCIVSKKHPRVESTLTIEQYLDERHVVVRSAGTGAWMIEAAVDRDMNPRNIVIELPTFLGLGQIVEKTDLLATIPIRLARVLAAANEIRIVPFPIKIPAYDVKQYWHERQHNSPANKWLRGVVANLAKRF